MDTVEFLGDFGVVELRRYVTKPDERQNFATCFESYFPEAFQQLGAIVFGQFLVRGNDNLFAWLRGFKDMYARASINGVFYYGPLWREHSRAMNHRLVDSDDVLLLRPLSPARAIPLLPAVDPVSEPNGASGVVIAQIFPVELDALHDSIRHLDDVVTQSRVAGLREAGVLVTLDAANNFPQHTIRTDGPFLVWLGLAKNDEALEMAQPLLAETAKVLGNANVLRSQPELLIMDPTRRSRLRWSDR